ncbi:MAG TPA: hypothetical protein VNM45_09555 [Bacillus sp. (in: firmicutes)]|nr:hypothetical protein [Bacillus sp. (in: firmicutes)]
MIIIGGGPTGLFAPFCGESFMIKDPVLAKEWQPAAYSYELTDRPVQVYILEERVV